MKITVSVVVPFFNERENLPTIHSQLIKVLKNIPGEKELIYVDDGSTDDSSAVLKKTVAGRAGGHVKCRLARLRRNFGQTAALEAGISLSHGELLAFLDADLQNDPEDIPKLIEALNNSYDMMVGWRKKRQDEILRKFVSALANLIIRKAFDVPVHDLGCALKVARRGVIADLSLYSEYHRLLPAIVHWQGYRVGEVTVNHRKRIRGKSNYGFNRIFKLLVDLTTIKFIQYYATKPGYIFGSIGLFLCFISILPTVITLYEKLSLGVYVHRNPLFLVGIFLFLLGVQFIFMGLMSELIVRTYFESSGKKIYELGSVTTI